MGISLGPNRYGKAETRVVRVRRDTDEHEIVDLTVSVALSGELTTTHLTGDNAPVLPTDSMKNTVYAFAKDGVNAIEEFGLRLARHFVDSQPTISVARVKIQQHEWRRLGPHSFARQGEGTRTARVTYDGTIAAVVSGIADLTLLSTTDSAFEGFIVDPYTTLAPASDRVLATVVNAAWRHVGPDSDWDESYAGARAALVSAFVDTYSRSLQQTLYAMGAAVLADRPELAEVRLALPNKHHFLVDLKPFDRENPGEVFHAADRPYGLIEGTVLRDDAPAAGLAWTDWEVA